MPYTVELKLPMENKDFLIDQEKLIFHDTLMEIPEITGFAYGMLVNQQNGMTVNTSYHFKYIDSSGDEIKIDFQRNMFMWNSDEAYKLMSAWTWHYLAGQIYNRIQTSLINGESFTVGKMRVSPMGIAFVQKTVFGKATDYLVRWEDLRHEAYELQLNLRSITDPEVDFTQGMLDYNVQVFTSFLDQLKINKNMISQFNTANRTN